MEARIVIFERPGADLTLREVLEATVSPEHARILMKTPSLFVVVAPASASADAYYGRCETLGDVLNALSALARAFGGDVEDVSIHLAVEPEMQRLLESAIAGIAALGQLAANEP